MALVTRITKNLRILRTIGFSLSFPTSVALIALSICILSKFTQGNTSTMITLIILLVSEFLFIIIYGFYLFIQYYYYSKLQKFIKADELKGKNPEIFAISENHIGKLSTCGLAFIVCLLSLGSGIAAIDTHYINLYTNVPKDDLSQRKSYWCAFSALFVASVFFKALLIMIDVAGIFVEKLKLYLYENQMSNELSEKKLNDAESFTATAVASYDDDNNNKGNSQKDVLKLELHNPNNTKSFADINDEKMIIGNSQQNNTEIKSTTKNFKTKNNAKPIIIPDDITSLLTFEDCSNIKKTIVISPVSERSLTFHSANMTPPTNSNPSFNGQETNGATRQRSYSLLSQKTIRLTPTKSHKQMTTEVVKVKEFNLQKFNSSSSSDIEDPLAQNSMVTHLSSLKSQDENDFYLSNSNRNSKIIAPATKTVSDNIDKYIRVLSNKKSPKTSSNSRSRSNSFKIPLSPQPQFTSVPLTPSPKPASVMSCPIEESNSALRPLQLTKDRGSGLSSAPGTISRHALQLPRFEPTPMKIYIEGNDTLKKQTEPIYIDSALGSIFSKRSSISSPMKNFYNNNISTPSTSPITFNSEFDPLFNTDYDNKDQLEKHEALITDSTATVSWPFMSALDAGDHKSLEEQYNLQKQENKSSTLSLAAAATIIPADSNTSMHSSLKDDSANASMLSEKPLANSTKRQTAELEVRTKNAVKKLVLNYDSSADMSNLSMRSVTVTEKNNNENTLQISNSNKNKEKDDEEEEEGLSLIQDISDDYKLEGSNKKTASTEISDLLPSKKSVRKSELFDFERSSRFSAYKTNESDIQENKTSNRFVFPSLSNQGVVEEYEDAADIDIAGNKDLFGFTAIEKSALNNYSTPNLQPKLQLQPHSPVFEHGERAKSTTKLNLATTTFRSRSYSPTKRFFKSTFSDAESFPRTPISSESEEFHLADLDDVRKEKRKSLLKLSSGSSSPKKSINFQHLKNNSKNHQRGASSISNSNSTSPLKRLSLSFHEKKHSTVVFPDYYDLVLNKDFMKNEERKSNQFKIYSDASHKNDAEFKRLSDLHYQNQDIEDEDTADLNAVTNSGEYAISRKLKNLSISSSLKNAISHIRSMSVTSDYGDNNGAKNNNHLSVNSAMGHRRSGTLSMMLGGVSPAKNKFAEEIDNHITNMMVVTPENYRQDPVQWNFNHGFNNNNLNEKQNVNYSEDNHNNFINYDILIEEAENDLTLMHHGNNTSSADESTESSFFKERNRATSGMTLVHGDDATIPTSVDEGSMRIVSNPYNLSINGTRISRKRKNSFLSPISGYFDDNYLSEGNENNARSNNNSNGANNQHSFSFHNKSMEISEKSMTANEFPSIVGEYDKEKWITIRNIKKKF